MDPAERWNVRYGETEYLFGRAPARFLVEHENLLPDAATVLCIADGEGRNGAWLAARGHVVSAFDVSERAHEKALALDRALGVHVERVVSGLAEWRFPADRWDVIVASMVQFAEPALRDRMFHDIRGSVRPGGIAMIHGYTPKQVEYGTGGPPTAENMYTSAMLEQAFSGWDLIVLREYERELVEGTGHVGRSALIDMVGRRPASADEGN